MAVSPTPFRGVWPALLTPLNATLDIDLDKFATHARRLLDAGCQGVTPFGTTGEGPSFSMQERIDAIDGLIARGIPAKQILVSTSCAALPETLALTRHALDVGAHGCLMLPPFFLKNVPDEGVVDAYAYVIDGASDPRLKLYLYHIPQVTGVGVSSAVIRELKLRYPDTVVGIKDSCCDITHSMPLAEEFMPGIMVYVGNEADLPAMARAGSSGAVSGMANMLPRLVQRLISQPDAAGSASDLRRANALLTLLGGYALMPALKGIMSILDDDRDWLRVRPPLVALTEVALQQLAVQLKGFPIDRTVD